MPRNILAAALAASLATTVSAQTPAQTASAMMDAVFIRFDESAAEELLTENYIQHNPNVPTGRAPILGFIPALKASGISLKTHRIIADGNLVVMHNSYSHATALGADNLVAFDVFRIENGRVAEHWDNIAVLAPPNPSGHSQTDGPTKIADRAHSADNKALIEDFVQAVLVGGQTERLPDFFNGNNYIQHNSQIADGLDGLASALGTLAAQGQALKYETLHQIIGEGNFVFTMSEGRLGEKPTAFFDLFRIENGKIAEHWDIVSEIPADMAHNNGKF